MHKKFITSLIALSISLANAHAGSSTSSRGSSASSRSSAASSMKTTSTSQYASKPSISPARSLNKPSNRLAQKNRQSLIPSTGPQPSPHITEIIREKESSGPGWLGTAFLISLLSRHDLSSSDRGWIESRINSISKEDQTGADLLKAVKPRVLFDFKGLDDPLVTGQVVKLKVSATNDGKAVSVACDHPGAIKHDNVVSIEWTPDEPTILFLTCNVGQQQERRLIHVIAATNSKPHEPEININE